MKSKLLRIIIPVFVLLLIVVGRNHSFAQARLVLGATATYINISGGTAGTPIYLVIGDATANAATNTIARTAGWIISEGEFNYVKWNVGSSASAGYVVPWGYSTTTYMPLQFDLSTGGTEAAGAGTLAFSTYRTPANNTPFPTSPAVTNMSSSAGGGPLSTIDRFWSIDATGYSAGLKPLLGNVNFYYDNAEVNLAGNTGIAAETNLQAQRYNSTTNSWEAATFLQGTDFAAGPYPGGDYVQVTGPISDANLYKWWTLVDKFKPLPVEFIDLSAECSHSSVVVKWSTASEQNSDYFTIERSLDGTNFAPVGNNIPASGNSSTVKNYSAVDYDSYSGTAFYRVKETDFNGAFYYSSTLTASGCSGDDIIIYGEDGGAGISINAETDGQYNIEMYDMLGQKLVSELKNVAAGNNPIKLNVGNISSAVYVIKVYNSQNVVAKKIFIRSSVD